MSDAVGVSMSHAVAGADGAFTVSGACYRGCRRYGDGGMVSHGVALRAFS